MTVILFHPTSPEVAEHPSRAVLHCTIRPFQRARGAPSDHDGVSGCQSPGQQSGCALAFVPVPPWCLHGNSTDVLLISSRGKKPIREACGNHPSPGKWVSRSIVPCGRRKSVRPTISNPFSWLNRVAHRVKFRSKLS